MRAGLGTWWQLACNQRGLFQGIHSKQQTKEFGFSAESSVEDAGWRVELPLIGLLETFAHATMAEFRRDSKWELPATSRPGTGTLGQHHFHCLLLIKQTRSTPDLKGRGHPANLSLGGLSSLQSLALEKKGKR